MKINAVALAIVVLILLAAFAQPLKECLQELNATRISKDSLLALLIGLAVFVFIVRLITGPSGPRDK